MSQYLQFVSLHRQGRPFVLANVWDVASARVFETAGYPALGTSSAAVAAALGYADGEAMPFAALHALARRLVAAVGVPVSVDLEGGYSRSAAGVCQHVEQLAAAGVVGINLEDSVVEPAGRRMGAADAFAVLLETVKNHLVRQRLDVFLNVRTDAFLLGHPEPVAETLRRATAYEAAGADGLFAPGAVEAPDIRELAAGTRLPLNVMCLPQLPAFGELGACGVRRISMGDFVHQALLKHLARQAEAIWQAQSFESLF